jgi:hypothetical protein
MRAVAWAMRRAQFYSDRRANRIKHLCKFQWPVSNNCPINVCGQAWTARSFRNESVTGLRRAKIEERLGRPPNAPALGTGESVRL